VECKGGVAQPYASIRFPACSCREVVRLSPHQKVLLESVYSKEEKQSPTEVYREFNNIMRLSGREQVSHKTLSELTAELELYGYVEVERKGARKGSWR